jgi:citrate synthase
MIPPIAHFSINKLEIRGRDIADLIARETFLGTLVLTLTGEKAQTAHLRMLDCMLIAWADHGENPPSTQNVRNVASVGQGFQNAVIAGLATFGGTHEPIEQAGKFLQQLVLRDAGEKRSFIKSFTRVPGYGHPVHIIDPRCAPLLQIAARSLPAFLHTQALRDGERILNEGRASESDGRSPLLANLAGVTAALWLDLGFSLETIGLVPVLGRIVGWAAHYAEQRQAPAFSGSVPATLK